MLFLALIVKLKAFAPYVTLHKCVGTLYMYYITACKQLNNQPVTLITHLVMLFVTHLKVSVKEYLF